MNLLTDILRTLLGVLGQGVRSVVRVFVDGLRVLAQHWPQLLGLFLAGWTGRMAFLWLTTLVSDVSPTAAIFILPLAPLSTLLSMVLMLRAMAPTLSAFSGMVEKIPPRQRWIDDLTVAAQVLIPFLAVYASAGLLKEDVNTFLLDSFIDEEYNTNIQSIDYGRAVYAEGWALVALVVGALVVRKIISLMDLAERSLAWAAAGTYVEVLWTVTLANAMASQFADLTDWVMSRRAIAGTAQWWEGVVEVVSSWAGWIAALVEATADLLENMGELVVLPVAWLAIGAAVYGHSLKAQELKVETHEDVTRRIKRVPQPVRRAVAHAVEPVTTPVQDALTAIGKIASAGIIPMVLFCIVFVVAGRLQLLAAELVRFAIGPGKPLRQLAFEPYALLVERGVYFLVALPLLAAAVNAVVTSQREQAAAEASEAGAPGEVGASAEAVTA